MFSIIGDWVCGVVLRAVHLRRGDDLAEHLALAVCRGRAGGAVRVAIAGTRCGGVAMAVVMMMAA